jgi:hypothetical protein
LWKLICTRKIFFLIKCDIILLIIFGYIWSDFKQNTEILEVIKVTPIQDKISDYETDWRNHVNRMSRSRLRKLITQYIPEGRKDQGKPTKKLTNRL